MSSPYFERKRELKEKAEKHTKEMEQLLAKETAASVRTAKIYGGDKGDYVKPVIPVTQRTEVIPVTVDNLDSVNSIFQHRAGKTAVLNFASYKHPGGMFLDGSSAQEECLCHASNLYNVLKHFSDYYAWNQKHLNKAFYTNRAIYAKDIVFLNDKNCVYGVEAERVPVDVITCAAPNWTAVSRYATIKEKDSLLDENKRTLLSRIKFILDIAEENGVETLILGAFGCGVFGQDARTVALYFNHCLNAYEYHFKHVYFSMINRKNNNYQAFVDTIRE